MRAHLLIGSLVATFAACSASRAPSSGTPGVVGEPSTFVKATDPHVAIMGRAQSERDGSVRFGYPGVTLRIAFAGASLGWRAASTSSSTRMAVIVDGAPAQTVRLNGGQAELLLVEGLGEGEHHVDVVHRTEAWQGIVTVDGFLLGEHGQLLDPKPWPERRLLVIGDSVTSGEGVDRAPECETDKPAGSNAYLSYGMRLARALDAQVHLVSHGGRGLVRDWEGKRDVLNAPQFFQLSVPEEDPKVLWNHAAYRPDVVLVSLGTNDFNLALGPPPKQEEYVAAYVSFVRAMRGVYAAARIFLTEGAMINDDADAVRPQKSILRAYIAETVKRLKDDRVRAIPSNHYPGDACDAHPTGEQHASMAHDLEPIIRQAMGW